MRILHVNKFLYRRGGAEGYMFDLAALQAARGDDVTFFGMSHPDNEAQRHEHVFPSEVTFEPMPDGLVAKVSGFGRMLWSTSSRRGIATLLRRERPDVAHLHNVYHQLSPSILGPLAAAGVPIVMTLHDYKLACPTYQFLDKGVVCEACIGGRFHNAARRRCKGGSLVASSAAAIELTLHTALRAYGHVSRFVCPSRFLAAKMDEAGVFPDRLRHLPHFIDVASYPQKQTPGGRIAFAGRLSAEKGIDVLVDAVGRLDGVGLDIAGDGPERVALEQRAQTVARGRVTFHGRLAKDELHDLVRASVVTAVPSRWYENQPMAVLESFGCGVPVVGTTLGGLPELIDDGATGCLVPPNDVEATAVALGALSRAPERAFAMGRAARAFVESEFTPERHLEGLDAIYAEAGANP